MHEFPRLHIRRCVAAALTTMGLCLAAAPVIAQQPACGSLDNGYGPFDYRTNRGKTLETVEAYHFTPGVEALVKGNTGRIGGDLDYTLRAFPNHHRALISMTRYAERSKLPTAPAMPFSVECYYERALRFQPDDTIVRTLLAGYLERTGRSKQADQQLEQAARDAKDNPMTHYNIGLAYLDAKKYDRALAQAHKAAALGKSGGALRDGLVAAGRWREADPAIAAAAPTAAASAASAR